jgi:hypothetical protein
MSRFHCSPTGGHTPAENQKVGGNFNGFKRMHEKNLRMQCLQCAKVPKAKNKGKMGDEKMTKIVLSLLDSLPLLGSMPLVF